MQVKLQVVGFKEHDKGGVFVFRTQYGDRISAFVFKDELSDAMDRFTKESVHQLDVYADTDKNGQPCLSINTKPDVTEPLF